MEAKTKHNIRPIGSRVVVRIDEADSVSEGGIILPDNAKEQKTTGIVLAVGAGRLMDDGTRAAMQVAVTDRVMFKHYEGVPIEVNDEELLVLDEDQIICVLEAT